MSYNNPRCSQITLHTKNLTLFFWAAGKSRLETMRSIIMIFFSLFSFLSKHPIKVTMMISRFFPRSFRLIFLVHLSMPNINCIEVMGKGKEIFYCNMCLKKKIRFSRNLRRYHLFFFISFTFLLETDVIFGRFSMQRRQHDSGWMKNKHRCIGGSFFYGDLRNIDLIVITIMARIAVKKNSETKD